MSNTEENLIKPKTLEEVRAMIKSHKRNDFIFSSIGLLTIVFALLTLLILFVDLVMDGYPKLNYEFFTDFPSRRALARTRERWTCSATFAK